MKLKNFMFSCEHKFFDSHEQCVSVLAASQQDAERIFAVYYPHWFVLEVWEVHNKLCGKTSTQIIVDDLA